MAGVNKVIILGHLGSDPSVRHTQNGTAIATISVATSESWKDKQTGERQERTEWHKVAFWGRLAEIAGEYLRKGSKVYIEGKLQTRKWQDKDCVDRYTTEVIAKELQMLDARRETVERRPHQENHTERFDEGEPFNDDIPF